MNILDQFNLYLFSIGDNDILLSYVLVSVISAIVLLGIFVFVKRHLLEGYVKSRNLDLKEKRRLVKVFVILLFLVWLTITFLAFQLDFSIYQFGNDFDLRLSTILKAFLVIQVASFVSRISIESLKYSYSRTTTANPGAFKGKTTTASIRQIRTTVILLVLLVLLDMFDIDLTFFTFKDTSVKLSGILMAAVVLIGARVLGWILTEIVLASYYGRSQSKKLDEGNRYAINRLLSYFLYTMAFLFALSAIGLNLTLLWGGAAALLVGVGLGLQQTFNDVFSGILLLFERSVEVGDWVEMETNIGRVTQIGLRTSVVKGRDDISVIVPNSILVTQKVINWSHHDSRTRFSVSVGVAYGSDAEQVKKILIEVTKNHSRILETPGPKVRLVNFGDSSLDFEILFWARHFHSIEDIKSDIRFDILKAFKEADISIPFPQRDVWMR